jgi:hypothetical protein
MEISKFSKLLLGMMSVLIYIGLVMRSRQVPVRHHLGASVKRLIEQHPAATGKEFSGEKIRTFLESDLKVQLKFTNDFLDEKESKRYAKNMCDKWGVLTTISAPTEAVRRFLYKPDWCIVVVGDLQKPKVSYPGIYLSLVEVISIRDTF